MSLSYVSEQKRKWDLGQPTCPALPGTFLALALQVPLPGNTYSPRQTGIVGQPHVSIASSVFLRRKAQSSVFLVSSLQWLSSWAQG